jgi:hypothetical protein
MTRGPVFALPSILGQGNEKAGAKQNVISMSNILLAIMGLDAKGWEQRFRALAPQHETSSWPESFGDPAKMDYACVWNPPAGLLAEFPKLRATFSSARVWTIS